MFTDMSTAEVLKLLLPFLIVELGLIIFCLYRLTKDKVKYLPKWAWALIIVFVSLFGTIAYLLIGRERE